MSNSEKMVSVPPYIGLEPLVGRYYPAKCRRCGWVGSSSELTEDDAQCTRDAGDHLCLGDCDELDSHDLLGIIQAMAEHHLSGERTDMVEQQQDLPVAFGDPKAFENFANLAHLGGAYAREWMWAKRSPGLVPLFLHPDSGDLQRLVAANTEFARRHLEREALLRDLLADDIAPRVAARIESALAAGAEPSGPDERDELKQSGVLKLGIYGKAYDLPGTYRAYTYSDQPHNNDAHKLGRASLKVGAHSDLIDIGLSLLKALQDEGFGVFEIAALEPKPEAKS